MIVGVKCMCDGTYQSFDTCLQRHANYEKQCDALPFAIKLIRDNHLGRVNAGLSASSLTGCPREMALLEKYDYYASIPEQWILGEGTLFHAMIEHDTDPNPNYITERRYWRNLDVDNTAVRISGQMDVIDKTHRVLLDYKRKEKVPTKPDPTHEFQWNIYVWILRDGVDIETNEPFQLEIDRGGMFYISRNRTQPFLKIAYPKWDNADIEDTMRRRLKPILAWRNDHILPKCQPYQTYGPSWVCGCAKIEEQARELGTWKD